MKEYIITTCSTVDLNVDKLKEKNVNYINDNYYLDDKEYFDDISKRDNAKNFYDNLSHCAEPKTSQVNTESFLNYFKPFLDKGLDILHISFSSGLSGSYNSARLAAQILNKEYPNNKVVVVDSLAASSGLGLLVINAIDKKNEGCSLLDLEQYLNEIKLNLNHWFYSTDLKYYIKGGRITKVQGFIGNTLNLCPILNVNNQGKLIPRYKVIGKKRVINKILNLVLENIDNQNEYNGSIYISHSLMEEDALIIKKRLSVEYPHVKEVVINEVGPVIGSHTGPGTIAIFFFGKKRNE